MEKRLIMAFDGWACQFENPPAWRPKIQIKNNCIYVDNHKLEHAAKTIEVVSINIDNITIYWENYICKICIEWPHDSEPYIDKIEYCF